jgi:hypothetical protein
MSEHRITAKIGEGETELTIDIAYSYKPEWPADSMDPGAPAEMEVIKAVVVGDEDFNNFLPAYVRDLAQNWLDDEGYEMACQHAERERHGDYE